MPVFDFNKGDLLERLKLLDEELSTIFPSAEQFKLVIVGGSALVLVDCISRSTRDIDVRYISHRIEDILAQYGMNIRVQAYLCGFPFSLEDRLIPIEIETYKTEFYTARLEDIVISKLYAAHGKDIIDITTPSVLNRIDWNLLHHLAYDESELKANALSDRGYDEFIANYEEFEGRYRPCGN